MQLSATAELGLSMRFLVVVDGIDLGGWSNCAGLSVRFGVQKIKEGGNNDYEVLLPGRLEYNPITLKRAMTAKDSKQVQQWLRAAVDRWVNGEVADYRWTGYRGSTAQITLLDQHQQPVAVWALRNVFPTKWSGPDLDATSSKVAIETLELVHEGFL